MERWRCDLPYTTSSFESGVALLQAGFLNFTELKNMGYLFDIIYRETFDVKEFVTLTK